jgi:hypothetical protein
MILLISWTSVWFLNLDEADGTRRDVPKAHTALGASTSRSAGLFRGRGSTCSLTRTSSPTRTPYIYSIYHPYFEPRGARWYTEQTPALHRFALPTTAVAGFLSHSNKRMSLYKAYPQPQLRLVVAGAHLRLRKLIHPR